MSVIIHPTLPFIIRSDGFIAVYSKSSNQSKEWTTFSGFKQGSKDHHGYMSVKYKGKNYPIHRLIAEAFIPNTEGKPTVDHINRVREDNRVENLRWATHHEQRENSSGVLFRKDYGVRRCDDKKAYTRAYSKDRYHKNPEKYREYALAWYHSHKDEINARRRKKEVA